MSYKNYQHRLDLAMNQSKIRRELKAIFGKKPFTYADFLEIKVEGIRQLEEIGDYSSNMLLLLGRENHWVSTGSPTIFIENKELATSLYSSSFDIKNNFNVDPPYKTFALSFPENTVIEGIRMTNGLVSIMTLRDILDISKDVLGLNLPPETDRGLDALYICVNVNGDKHHFSISHSHLSVYEDPASKEYANGDSLDEVDILAKIALSLCVYHSATDGRKLKKGYPESAVHLSKGKTRLDYKGLTLCSTKPYQSSGKKSEKGERKITQKVPFFRNLRAQRYYQGKHKDKALGTRWVWVKEIDINNSMNTLLS